MKEAGVKGSSFIGRLPLWATLIPLVLGVAFWGWMWRDYAARFQTDLEAVAVQAGALKLQRIFWRPEATWKPIFWKAA